MYQPKSRDTWTGEKDALQIQDYKIMLKYSNQCLLHSGGKYIVLLLLFVLHHATFSSVHTIQFSYGIFSYLIEGNPKIAVY